MKKNRPKAMNREIIADPVRVATTWNQGLRTVSLSDALALAAAQESDLILVNDEASPPICRIVERGMAQLATPMGIDELPLPLALAISACEEEREPFRKVHRLIDALEVLVKLHTAMAVGRYFQTASITNDLKGLMCGGLRAPSLGIWWAFAREFNRNCLETGQKKDALARFLGANGPLFREMEGEDNLIGFRNRYAHGATPDNAHCDRDVQVYGARFKELWQRAMHFRGAALMAICRHGGFFGNPKLPSVKDKPSTQFAPGRCYLFLPDGDCLDLHPLLVFREEEERFYFYNDLRKQAAVLLNYEKCLFWRDRDLHDAVLQTYPIHEWAETATETFRERIELLTETFKGRHEELQRIMAFVTKENRGFLFVWGGPGVGKSALMARVFQALNWSTEIRHAAGFGDATPKLHVIEYFIRRDMQTNNADDFFAYLHNRLDARFRTGVKAGRSLREKISVLRIQLEQVSARLAEDERLILIIDGLDEATEAPELLDALPRSLPARVLVIYASREHPEVRDRVYANLEREHRDRMTLEGLNEQDTRALLYAHINKYQLKQDYIAALMARSAGNPLYLQLVCQGLARGDYQLNDAINLPKRLEDIYEDILRRVAGTPQGLDLLRLLAVARDYLTVDMISGIMGLPLDTIQYQVLPACREVLFENPMTATIDDYQLFHESLREYLLGRSAWSRELDRWRLRLCDWCEGWKSMQGPAHLYSLRHLAHHLLEMHALHGTAGDEEGAMKYLMRLIRSVENDEFRQSTFRYLGHSGSLKYAMREIQKILASRDRNGEHMDRILRYAWMMHAEEEEMYTAQVDAMLTAAREGNLENVADYALIGLTSQERLLLSLRALWQAPTGTRIPPQLENAVTGWLKQNANPVMMRLWETTIDMIGTEAVNMHK